VLIAVREREAAVADADRLAGKALRDMTEDEGLSVREAVKWCGDEITTREATWLRRLVEDDQVGEPKMENNSAVGTAEGLARGATALPDIRVPPATNGAVTLTSGLLGQSTLETRLDEKR